MDESNRNIYGVGAHGGEALHRLWGWFLVLGILMLLLGIIAIAAEFVATLLTVTFLGWLLVFAGVASIVHSFATHRWGGFFLSLLTGLLYLGVGLLMVFRPLVGAVSLTLLIASFFIVNGIFRIVTSLTYRMPHFGWVLLNGMIAVLLGVLIWMQWPASALWVIGTFVGIEMIFAGWSFIMMSAVGRHLTVPPARTA